MGKVLQAYKLYRYDMWWYDIYFYEYNYHTAKRYSIITGYEFNSQFEILYYKR